MSLFERFDQHKVLYSYLLVAAYLFANNTINASSDWMEQTRDGSPSIAIWEPYLWEYSSAISTLILLPAVFYLFNRFSPRLTQLKQQIFVHLCASVVFSLAHVTIMVAIREWVYHINELEYNFGPWLREFWYEYRKDAWGYLFFFCLYHMMNYIYVRLKGEASPIAEDEEQAEQLENYKIPEHFLVKKLDKEFLVKVSDIEWLESSGNYVNLHVKGRIYPLRATLTNMAEKLDNTCFSRVHRSYAVNHNFIDNISYQSSGDGEIQLKSGHKLNLSRRYKESFKLALS